MTIKIILLCLLIVWAIVFITTFLLCFFQEDRKFGKHNWQVALIAGFAVSTVFPIFLPARALSYCYKKVTGTLKPGEGVFIDE